MGWQRPVQKLAIKQHVRRRDGNVCVVCGLDEATQKKRYGKILEVHRTVPKSDYSTKWGRCLALCNVCHDALHSQGNWGWVMFQDFHDEDDLTNQVLRTCRRDAYDERVWRRREAWGTLSSGKYRRILHIPA